MHRLRPYQADAVTSIADALASGGTGQVHAACGTGKTFIAQRGAEALLGGSGTVAVLTPSLALVAQTLAHWRQHASDGSLPMLAVCSDDTIADAPVHLAQLDTSVSTRVPDIMDWLREPSAGLRLVVGTYASADRLSEAVRATAPLDLLILDEAHHLAGRPDAATRRVVDSACLPAHRRLYMTATPRLDDRINPSTGTALLSMDDASVFGPVLANYSFPQAISEGHLKDYRIAVIGIADRTARQLLSRHGTEFVDRLGAPSLQTIVAQAALARARDMYGIRRALTFHPRIADAAQFARSLPETLARLGADADPLYSNHVHGGMEQRLRNRVLDRLRVPPSGGWSVVSNARCLGEGVDVPAVDAILFAHPKRSAVDIVQAVGRALRPHPETPGPSTLIVPLVVPDADSELVDLEAGDYTTLWQVVRALRAHDEPLGMALDRARSHESTGIPQLPGKITVVLPDGTSQQILDQLGLLTVRQTTSPWFEGYSRAAAYNKEHGDLEVPLRYRTEDGYTLGQWLVDQRQLYRRGWLQPARITALEELGITWDPNEARWRTALRHTARFRAANGHLDISGSHVTPDGFKLGDWVERQRRAHRAGKLSPERVAALDRLGMLWSHPRRSAFDRHRAALITFQQDQGHTFVPQGYVTSDGLKLGRWVAAMRFKYRDGRLPADQVDALDAIGMEWSAGLWGRGLAAATQYASEHGHLNPADDVVIDGIRLRVWLDLRRKEYRAGSLESARIAALEAIHLTWEPADPWADWLIAARAYVAEHGNLDVPYTYTMTGGRRLGEWITRQRYARRQGRLRDEQIKELEELGLRWNGDMRWERSFSAAKAFVAERGHLRPESGTKVDGVQLDAWLRRLRRLYRDGALSPDRVRALEELGMEWQVGAEAKPCPQGVRSSARP
jgi:superfamily II DNA or RNA helicase